MLDFNPKLDILTFGFSPNLNTRPQSTSSSRALDFNLRTRQPRSTFRRDPGSGAYIRYLDCLGTHRCLPELEHVLPLTEPPLPHFLRRRLDTPGMTAAQP